jgi:hypothetical protein
MDSTKEIAKQKTRDKRNKQKEKKVNQNLTFEILSTITGKRR